MMDVEAHMPLIKTLIARGVAFDEIVRQVRLPKPKIREAIAKIEAQKKAEVTMMRTCRCGVRSRDCVQDSDGDWWCGDCRSGGQFGW